MCASARHRPGALPDRPTITSFLKTDVISRPAMEIFNARVGVFQSFSSPMMYSNFLRIRVSRRMAERPTNPGQWGDCPSWSCPAVNVTLLKPRERAPLFLWRWPVAAPSHPSCRLLVNSSPANRMETSTLGNEPVQERTKEGGREGGQWQTMAS